jgi:2-isopropylmalate synthase
VIEAGFAAASPGDFAGVRAAARAVSKPTVCSLARSRLEDIACAAEALASSGGRTRIHIFLATSPLHMERKLCLEPEEVVQEAERSVAYAAGLADEVEFSCEDATRSDAAFVARVCETAIRAGARIINLPDTVGYTLPDEYRAFLHEVGARCPLLSSVELSVHCHDDLGLATANTLAGVQAGATQVECTVNGIGERAGNAALEEVVMALRTRAEIYGVETKINIRELHAVSRLVSELTGYAVQRNKAVVGENAFAHEAGIHQDGMLKDAATYQILDPAELGLVATLPLGKHSGRHAFKRQLEAAGHALTPEALEAAFRRFKVLADDARTPSLDEVLEGTPV